MRVNTALTRISSYLDDDNPLAYVKSLRALLASMRKGLDRSGLDAEVIDFINEYIDTWLVPHAIEEDIDSFQEETNDVLEKVTLDDEDDNEDETDIDDDDSMMDEDY